MSISEKAFTSDGPREIVVVPLAAALELEAELAAEREDRDGNYIHADEVQAVCQQAWKTPQGFSQSPLELIGRIIDERDYERERADALAADLQRVYGLSL